MHKISTETITMKILDGLGKEISKSQYQKQREEVLETAGDYVDSFDWEIFTPPNVVYPEYQFQANNLAQPILPHEEYQANEKLDYILNLAGLSRENVSIEMQNAILEPILELIQNKQEIPDRLLKDIANKLLESL